MNTDPLAELQARVERLESLDEIRQLASKYGLAIDMRDIDALVHLYCEDTRVSKDERGRPALKRIFDQVMRQFTATAHQTGNHIIEFDDANHANGVVYNRAEHEIGGEWVVMQMLYIDRYKRVDGRWYFQWRLPLSLYGSDLNKPPVGDRKIRWPGAEPIEGTFHSAFPSWQEFWANPDIGEHPLRPAAAESFIQALRRGLPLPPFPPMMIEK